jgi:hypothetical protein
MQSESGVKEPAGEFLVRKSVFLLTSSIGVTMAEKLVNQAMGQIGVEPAALTQSNIASLADAIEPALQPFIGHEKARRLAAALRVLVGGVLSQ